MTPFLALGVERSAITFGHVLSDECSRLGVSVDDYLATYDLQQAQPYGGVAEMLVRLDRWAVCSNKHGPTGLGELERLGWKPEVALFASDFAGGPKQLGPVLSRLDVAAHDVVYVGDTDHDRRCARAAGVGFALAAWNPRAVAVEGDIVLARPDDLLELMPTRPSAG